MKKQVILRRCFAVIAMLMAMLLAVACKDIPDEEHESDDTATDTGETSTAAGIDLTEWMPLSQNGTPLYTVLYQTTGLEEGTTASDYAKIARSIVTKLNDKLGSELEFKAFSDRNIPSDALLTVTVGNISGYSDSYYNEMRFQDYRVRERDGNIAFAGYAYSSLYIASQHFLDAVELIEGNLYVRRTVLEESYISYYQISSVSVGGVPIDEYTIVCNDAGESMALDLRSLIRTYSGYLLHIVKDSEAASEHEIVVGITTRNTNDGGMTGHRIYRTENQLTFACADALEWAQILAHVDEKFKNVTAGGAFETDVLAKEYSVPADSRKLLTFNVKNVWVQNGNPGTRDDSMAALILEQMPDFICLQEYDVLYRNAKNGFAELVSSTYAEAVPSGTDLNHVWNPIFYNTTKYRVVETGFLYFPDSVDCIEYDYPGGGTADGLSKFRSLVWAVLEDQTNGTKYLVGNLHFSVARATHAGEADLVGNKIKEIAAKYPGCIALVAGDYNSKRTHSDGGLNYMLANGFTDTYDLANRRNDFGTTQPAAIGYMSGAIDHVLTLSEFPIYTYYVLTDEAWSTLSDHCPTIVQFSASEQ